MKKKSLIKIWIFICILLVIFLPPFIKGHIFRMEIRQRESKLSALEAEIKKLEEEKIKLQTDITYVERKAREKIGVVKKGEIILKETTSRATSRK